MKNIPNAEQSPRIVNGVIMWYEGDTFTVNLKLNLTDDDGGTITITTGDTVKVVFSDATGSSVKTFEFAGAAVSDNTVSLAFDTNCTALFPKGKYTYDVTFSRSNRTTVASRNKAVVE